MTFPSIQVGFSNSLKTKEKMFIYRKYLMTNVFKIALISSLIIIHVKSYAAFKEHSFEVFEKNVSFSIPEDWTSVSKEVGVPLKFTGPLFKGRRPVVMFVPIDLKKELMLKDPTKAEESYKLSRLKWLQKFNGESIKFSPLKIFHTHDGDIKFYEFSYLYSLNQDNFEEKSYYVKCKKDTYHMKTLIHLEHFKQWKDVVEKIIKSFNCV